jgi:pyridoxamine 5'-phosphate oxidase
MKDEDLARLRREYGQVRLVEDEMAANPFTQLDQWLGEALDFGVHEPSAMVLATVDDDQMPRARTVLLKVLDERGLGFHTNRRSQKGRNLAASPSAAVVFPWYQMERQVTARGPVEEMEDAESDFYFEMRPYGGQISAWASEQSTEIPSREHLETSFDHYRSKYPEGSVPRPPHWGGYMIKPVEVEFWQGGEHRLHDRLVYRRSPGADAWTLSRLSP